MLLYQGIPLTYDYQRLTGEEEFLRMERFSNDFLDKYASSLQKYLWVSDPFHQWSRQWEYPFAFSYIEEYIKNATEGTVNILDAGAGITFFPYYVSSTFKDVVMLTCFDADGTLPTIYREVNSKMEKPVEFVLGYIQQLPFEDNHFSVIYCISVIEHLSDSKPALSEFYRVLKPGGLLVITFDISFSMKHPIPPDRAVELVTVLESHFQPIDGFNSEDSLALLKKGDTSDILTTEWIKKTNQDLLPWRRRPTIRQIIGQLLSLKIPRNFVNLTCFCEAFIKN